MVVVVSCLLRQKKTRATLNETLNPQPYYEGIVVSEVVMLLNMGQVIVF
jgi:hypothetical protein